MPITQTMKTLTAALGFAAFLTGFSAGSATAFSVQTWGSCFAESATYAVVLNRYRNIGGSVTLQEIANADSDMELIVGGMHSFQGVHTFADIDRVKEHSFATVSQRVGSTLERLGENEATYTQLISDMKPRVEECVDLVRGV